MFKRLLLLMLCLLIVPAVFAATPAIPNDLSPYSGYATFVNTTNLVCGGVEAENFTIQWNLTSGGEVYNNIGVGLGTNAGGAYLGYAIIPQIDTTLVKIIKDGSSNCDQCRSGDEGGSPAAYTGVFIGNNCTLNMPMTAGVNYTVQCTISTGVHKICDACDPYPVVQEDLTFVAGVLNDMSRSASGHVYDIETIITEVDPDLDVDGYVNGTNNTVLINLTLGSQINWSCKACNTTGGYACSNWTSNQTINAMKMYGCADGAAAQAINYTIRDEQTQTAIEGNLTPNFMFSEGVYQPCHQSALTGCGMFGDSSTFPFCLAPVNITVALNSGEVLYLGNDTVTYDYSRNYYYFTGDELTGGVLSQTSLYLLDTIGTSTTFTIIVDGANLASGLLVVERYNEATGDYYQVAMKKISSGEAVLDLEHGTATYKFLIWDGLGASATLLCEVSEVVLSGAYSISCLSSGSTTNWWGEFVELRDTTYTFAFNNATNISALTWAIPTGVAAQNCYRVSKWEGASVTQEYYNCTSSTSGTFSYTLTDLDSNYNQQYLVQLQNGTCCTIVDGNWLQLTESLFDKVGDDTVLYTLLLVVMLGMAGLSISPAATVGLAGVGLVVSWTFGFLNIGIAALAAILLVGGILISKMRR